MNCLYLYRKLFILLTFLLISCSVLTAGQDQSGTSFPSIPDTSGVSNTILIPRPIFIAIDSASVFTAVGLLKSEIKKQGRYDAVLSRDWDIQSAYGTARQNGYGYVLSVNLSPLGEKIIIQYVLIDARTHKEILADNATSLTVEDLDQVMKRIALSISKGSSIDGSAEVGAIMASESMEPARRGARGFFGLNFGYLYPSSGYDESDQLFSLDLRSGYELDKVAVGLNLAARKGFAINLFSSYLLTRTDFCPYIGGGFGFHWVNHDEPDQIYSWDSSHNNLYQEKKDKRSDGFELLLNTGLRLFRTYNFEILINLDYSISFNDYHDKALVFTLGLLH
ncbi:MAG: hypothetical protein ACM3SM_15090 [Bacteroidota bacterium]